MKLYLYLTLTYLSCRALTYFSCRPVSNSSMCYVCTLPGIMLCQGGSFSGTHHNNHDTWARITFRKTFQNVIWPFPDLKAWFRPCECKAVSNQAYEACFETRKKWAFWIVICVESLILGHVNAKFFWNVICACAFWKCALKQCSIHAWVNQRGLRSRNKKLPRSAQILIVIGKAFAMHVTARS